MSDQLTPTGNADIITDEGGSWATQTRLCAELVDALQVDFNREKAVLLGRVLNERDGFLRDQIARTLREKTINYFMVCGLADAYLKRHGDTVWYEVWQLEQPYPYAEQSLHNMASVWRDEWYQRQYRDMAFPNISPTVLRAAVVVKNAEARGNLLSAAETGELTAEQVRHAATIMRRTGQTELPDVPRRGRTDLPDAQPVALTLYSLAMEGINKGMRHMLDELADESGWPVQWANEVKGKLRKAMREAGYSV